MTRDRDVEEARWGGNDWTIVTKLHDERTVGVYSILVQAVFRINGSEGRRGVGQGWRQDSCK